MGTLNLNDRLIDAMKDKVPAGVNLANMLMDILCLGKEATYRRLRGEVPFTFAEAVAISRKMEISLDQLIQDDSEKRNHLIQL